MFAEQEDLEDEDLGEDVAPEALDASEEDDDEEDDAALTEDEEEGDEASLDELLAERSKSRRGGEEAEEEEDLMSLVPEPDVAIEEVLPVKVIPVKDQEEFVCARCHLVKKKSQLVDEGRQLCRDCA